VQADTILRQQLAQRIARPRPLSLDHLGTEISEHGRRNGAGDDVPDVEHANAFEYRLLHTMRPPDQPTMWQ